MALDGIAIASIVNELNTKICNGRVDKTYQPENDEIVVAIRSQGNNYKLLLTANASNPRLHLTKNNKDNPMQPPLFCMVLRKHLTGGKITFIKQPSFERIVNIGIESLNELGDLTEKTLIIEIMGKHSNVILVDENNVILDAVKRVSHDKSAVREVLPGKTYSLPPSQDKLNPTQLDRAIFMEKLDGANEGIKIQKWIYGNYTGISPSMATEICYRCGVDSALAIAELNAENKESIFNCFSEIMNDVNNCSFNNEIYLDGKMDFVDFSTISMKQFDNNKNEMFDSPSEMLEYYYLARDNRYHILQKSQDLRRLIQTNIERLVKKADIQQKILSDIENRDLYKLYGELITANIYAVKRGMKSFSTLNFYAEPSVEIEIVLDEQKTPSENAQKYFKRYNKEKRTFEAVNLQIKSTNEELQYLEGVLNAAFSSSDEADLDEIRLELAEQGFAKRKNHKKGSHKIKKAKPMQFLSADGFHIFVGKSNIQNDELTVRFAEADDIWLHTKEIPGSHVLIKTDGKTPPDKTIEQAAQLAAYFSKAKNSSLVPVDYALRRNVKKPNGARPGMVIYDNYKTAYITPSEQYVNEIELVD